MVSDQLTTATDSVQNNQSNKKINVEAPKIVQVNTRYRNVRKISS